MEFQILNSESGNQIPVYFIELADNKPDRNETILTRD